MKIFLLRHAAYSGNDADPVLSNEGERMASAMASKIARLVGSYNTTIWTSPAKRASQTADIIAMRLGIQEVVKHDKLWSDNEHRHDFEWLREKLASHKSTEPLIIISHLEYVRSFFNQNEAGYGEGVVVETSDGIVHSIIPFR